MRLLHPTANEVQQGSIFNCTRIFNYEGCSCYGIIMTARCDLSHDKQTVINYLPIVKFSDWAERDLSFLLAKRTKSTVFDQIKNKLKQKNVTDLIINTYPLEDIIERNFAGADKKEIAGKIAMLKIAENCIDKRTSRFDDYRKLINGTSKESRAIVEDLIKQKLGEYYFLNCVDVYEKANQPGYVVLLRQMQTIPSVLINRIVKGLEANQLREDDKALLSFAEDTICMITGILRSPDMEHLAQQFTHLFARVGLDDQNRDTIKFHQEFLASH